MAKSRLSDLEAALSGGESSPPAKPAAPAKRPARAAKAATATASDKAIGESLPPRGQRGDFLKVNLMLPPEVFLLLKREKLEREIAGQRGVSVGELVVEAVVRTFQR